MKTLQHKFVEYMPESLEEAVVYVSIPFSLVSHRCCCGCGEEVVLKLSPLDWRLAFDGETISIEPSIGNWSLRCRSHYFITKNKVHWAPTWSDEKIITNRQLDEIRKGLAPSRSAGVNARKLHRTAWWHRIRQAFWR